MILINNKMSDLNALKITDARVTHTFTDLHVLHREGVTCCSLFISLLILAAFFFFDITFTRESKWIFSWLIASISVASHSPPPPPSPYVSKYFVFFFFARTVSIIFHERQRALIHRETHPWYVHWFRVFCTCFFVGCVAWLRASDIYLYKACLKKAYKEKLS